jgi:hypothetical protein
MNVSERIQDRLLRVNNSYVPLIVVYIYNHADVYRGPCFTCSLAGFEQLHTYSSRAYRQTCLSLSPKVGEMGATLELMLALSLDPSPLGAHTIRLSLLRNH